MTGHLGQAVDRFEELFDRDIETLLNGGTPANTDLIPLRRVVEELRSLADPPLSVGFIEFHAAESASTAAQTRAQSPARRRTGRVDGLVRNLRRRATATVATLVMLTSATGMAWAADGAVPGDWYYGLDRALESIGIGAGGAAERLQELEATTPDDLTEANPTQRPESDDTSLESRQGSTGLDRAAAVVSQNQGKGHGATSSATPRPVEKLLAYLNSTDHIDGAVMSALARGYQAQPETAPAGDNGTGRPDKSDESGNGVAAEDRGKPETPGKSGQSNRP